MSTFSICLLHWVYLVIVNPHLMWMLTTSKQCSRLTFLSSFIIMLCMIAHAYKMFKTTFWSHCLHKFWTIANQLCNTFKLHSTSFAFHLIGKMFLLFTKQFMHNLHKNWPSSINPINKKIILWIVFTFIWNSMWLLAPHNKLEANGNLFKTFKLSSHLVIQNQHVKTKTFICICL